MAPDVVVVGGGSAGCVLAARLSESPGREVVLVEAGADHRDVGSLPADVLDASQPTVDHDWGYAADPELGRGIALPRARIVGGCSATNACFALRGAPQDYDRWAALGNPGWTFAEVLDDFRRLEDDNDFRDEWHGAGGPVPIRRYRRDELTTAQAAFLDAAVELGHRQVDDHNRPGVVGAGPTPRNVRAGMRMSAAVTYLAAARTRPNLTIRPETLVARVEWSRMRATGVRLLDGTLIQADRVVLSAGTYASPMILARSGIGPASHLLGLGIRPLVDLPGVGSNLIDHPMVSVDQPTKPAPGPSRFQAHLTFHSVSADPDGTPDLLMFAAGPFEDAALSGGERSVLGLVTGLLAPRSRGWVRLASSAPTAPPRIHPGHLTDPEDLDRLVDAITEARRIARAEPMSALVTGEELAPGPDYPIHDRGALASWIRTAVTTFHHPVGTCAMGPDPEQGAVCDAQGSVHGVDGLTVADASIMPSIPAATTNLPTMMIAERISRWLGSA